MSFSARVASSNWRQAAFRWIRSRVEAGGGTVHGSLEPVRSRPWSAQFRLDSSAGALWFKANCRGLQFEAALHAKLAELAPAFIETPIATNADNGWILTTDYGDDLPQPASTRQWQDIITAMAHVQHIAADNSASLLATEIPDCRPETVAARFDALVHGLGALPASHPLAIDDDTVTTLFDRREDVLSACAKLDSFPATIQHGDLHPGNVRQANNQLRIIDFGNTQWSAGIEVLSVPRALMKINRDVDWQAVRESYFAQWRELLNHKDLLIMYQAIAFTQPINRAWTWWSILAEASNEEIADWGHMPIKNLLRLLEA